MTIYFIILFGVLTFIHSTFGGLLHGLAYSAVSSPVNYNFGRIASYSPPIIANPVAASYSTRYTAYTAVPLTASVPSPALIPRQTVGGFVRASFAGPSFSRHSGFSDHLVRQGVSAYAAVPIAGYRSTFRGPPSIRSYGVPSLRGLPAPLSVQGLYASAAGFDDYADQVLNDQRGFGSFENESPLSAW